MKKRGVLYLIISFYSETPPYRDLCEVIKDKKLHHFCNTCLRATTTVTSHGKIFFAQKKIFYTAHFPPKFKG